MRTRRQTRLLEESSGGAQYDLKDATGSSVDDKEDGLVDSPSEVPPQRKKRASGRPSKDGAKSSRRIKGKLAGVLALPVEVFMEIMRCLTLPDVLSLSRSNKFFRKMLMTRSAAVLEVWRTAIENVPGLPLCPKDLCEPQYAALIYSKHCSMCGTSVIRPMDPYLNIRLCKDCTEEHVMHVDEIEEPIIPPIIFQSRTTRMKNTRYGMTTCLIRDLNAAEDWCQNIIADDHFAAKAIRPLLEERLERVSERADYAKKMEEFLNDMAETRTREIEQLKEQRREDVKRRLKEAGWEEPDWIFPEFVARKWAALVESPHPLTEGAWQKLYKSLVPFLEKNRESHKERSRIVRKGKRLRRMRRLLLRIRNQNNLLEIDRKDVENDETAPDNPPTDVTTNNSITIDTPSASDHESDNNADHSSDTGTLPHDFTGSFRFIRARAPFPPMVDLLKWPIITKLLDTDTDADEMQAKFKELKGEIEDQIRAWGLEVEKELVGILKAGTADDTRPNGSEGEDQDVDMKPEMPQFKLRTKLAPKGRLMPDTRLLLRADSVFRTSEDTVAPIPLYFPDLFYVLQDRPDGYCSYEFQKLIYDPPKHGYSWDPREVAYYPEGTTAAKALLKDLGRMDAAHFELEALGPRFTCGLCGDNWVRTWNEMVQHYAEAIAHANMAAKAKDSIKKQIKYHNVHILHLDDKFKAQRKPIVVQHSAKEASALALKRRIRESLVKCNSCEQLGVDFQSPRDVMLKHVRTVHSIKEPKAEHYGSTNDGRMHIMVGDPMGLVSGSTEATDQEMVKDIRAGHSNYGLCVFWSYYGSHSKLHPGWDRRDF